MLSSAKLSLEPFERAHLDRLRAWINNPEICAFLGRAVPVSELEHSRWYEEQLGRADVVHFAIESNEHKRHIGNVWLWDIDHRHRKAEVRIVIGESDEQSKGLGAEALKLIVDYSFKFLNLHKVYAFVLEDNKRARRAFEKAGFVLEGTLRADRWSQGRFVDVYLLGCLNEPLGER